MKYDYNYFSPIMLMLNTEMAADTEQIRNGIKDIAQKGFDAICVEFRKCIFDENDPIGINAMRVVMDEAQKNNIKVSLTVPPHFKKALKSHPECRNSITVKSECDIINGAFRLEVPAVEHCLRGVKRFFLISDKITDVTDEISYSIQKDAQAYIYGECSFEGKLAAYLDFITDEIDYTCDLMENMVSDLLDIYDGYHFSGMALDEFGTGTRLEHYYNISDSFLRGFKNKFGYDFLDKIVYMDYSGEFSADVRCDYYEMTGINTYNFQKMVRKQFTGRFGKDIFTGFHSTWWGEGNSGDLWAGNIDYFKLTDNLSGGFVDAQYDAERTMLSMTLLAEGLAKYSETGHAYNMCWDRYPTDEKMDYYHRYLAVRNCRWVGHAYGDSGSFGPGYPMHSTWNKVSECIKLKKAFSDLYNDAKSKPRVAFLYLWRTMAALNDNSIHYHRLGMKALADKVQKANIEIDIIPEYAPDIDEYDVLFVSWGTNLSEYTRLKIESAVNKGKRVIFIGTPPGIANDFYEVSEREEYPDNYEYVAWDIWFTDEKINMLYYPLTADEKYVKVKTGGKICGVAKENVEYYSYEVALTEYFDEILKSLSAYKDIDGGGKVLSKTAYGGDYSVISLCGVWDSIIDIDFEFCGRKISVSSCSAAGIKIFDSGEIEAIGNRNAKIIIDGQEAEIIHI